MALLFSSISFYSLSLIHLLKHVTEMDRTMVTQSPKILSMNYRDLLVVVDLLFCLENKITGELLVLINEELSGDFCFLCQGNSVKCYSRQQPWSNNV